MIVCPLCEHQQDFGLECELCGKALGGLDDLGPPPVTAVPLEGLEATHTQPVGPVAVTALAELETRQVSGAVAVERMTELDATAAAPVGAVTSEAIELTEDRAPDDGIRTGLAENLTCRYCRNVQAPSQGAICERCGMSLPRLASTAAPSGVVPAASTEWTRCRSCGAPARVGGRCGDCGREVPPAT